MKSLVAAVVTAVVLVFSASALADPKSADNGCHGFYTTMYKELVGDRGAQGDAIGGRGNSDGDPTNGQAHSLVGQWGDAAGVPCRVLRRRIAEAVATRKGGARRQASPFR